jgi:hypothetical protein
MMSLRTFLPRILTALALGVPGTLRAAEIRPIEFLKNAGFEGLDQQGQPAGWQVNNVGKLSAVAGARTGKSTEGHVSALDLGQGQGPTQPGRVPVFGCRVCRDRVPETSVHCATLAAGT